MKSSWKPTWETLVADEPRLANLLARAQMIVDTGDTAYFCANSAWYGYGHYEGRGLKSRLSELVGWGRPKPNAGMGYLNESPAYDVAYETVYAVLPDCRGQCSCM